MIDIQKIIVLGVGCYGPKEKFDPYHAEMNAQKLGVNWSDGADGGSPSTMASISS